MFMHMVYDKITVYFVVSFYSVGEGFMRYAYYTG